MAPESPTGGEQTSLPKVQHVALGALCAGSIWWRFADQLSLTVCVKATFELHRNAPMKLVAPSPLQREEARRLPSLVVVAPADLVPPLRHPEMTLVGHAQPRAEVAEMKVRIGLTRGAHTLLMKQLRVCGDRGPDGKPQPFARMPLSYERALGGIGYANNPLGRGIGEVADEAAPNVLDIDAPQARVAGFGPIPAAFAERRKLLGGIAPKRMNAEVIELPDDFDWRYFQAAPSDQRLDAIVGDEWLWLEGMVADHQHVRTQLPSPVVAAHVYGSTPGSVPAQVALRAESIHVDTDERTCSVVWRGSAPVMGAVSNVLVVAGIAVEGEAIPWPRTAEELTALVVSQNGDAASEIAVQKQGETLMITDSGIAQKKRTLSPDETSAIGPELPFASATPFGDDPVPAAPEGDIPGAPWATEKAKTVKPPAGLATLTLEDESAQESLRAELARELEAKAEKADDDEQAERARAALLAAQEAAALRRKQEAERFEAEQRAAKEREEKALAAAKQKRREAADALLDDLYGGFKR